MNHTPKRSILFLFLMIFFSLGTFAQVGWKWGVSSIESYHALGVYDASQTITDNSGNIFVLGLAICDSSSFGPIKIYDPKNNTQLILTKVDPSGVFDWVIGSQNADVWPFSIATDAIGNLYVLASYDSATCSIDTVTLTNTGIVGIYFLAKISPTGHALWGVNIPGNVGCNYIVTDSSGNTYVSGEMFGPTLTIGSTLLTDTGIGTNMFIAKYDPLGNPLWAKNYGQGDCDVNTGAMAITNNGNIYVYGGFTEKRIPGSITIGGTILTSIYTRYGANTDFLAKFDNNGNPLWAKRITCLEAIQSMAVDAGENIYVTGYYDSTLFLGRNTLTISTKENILLAKYDSAGNAVWGNSAGSDSISNAATSIAVDQCGKLWISGSLYGAYHDTINFNGHYLFYPAAGSDPAFFAEYDTAGHYINGMTLLSGGDDILSFAVDNSGNLYAGADYWLSSMTFGTDILPPTDSAVEEFFAAKYQYRTEGDCSLVLQTEQQKNTSPIVTVFPNPAMQRVMITASYKINQITIVNLLGQTTYSQECNTEQVQVDVSNLPSGIYFVKINGTEVRKFVKE